MNITEIRKARGMSQAQLAERLNLSQACVSQYEKGTREPNLKTLRAIATILGVTIDELVK